MASDTPLSFPKCQANAKLLEITGRLVLASNGSIRSNVRRLVQLRNIPSTFPDLHSC